jgi:Flp pilus assembly protein TadD
VLVGPALGGTPRIVRGAGAVRAGVLLAGVVIVAGSALVVFGETRLSASREAAARNDLPAAAAAARDAAAIVPWSSKPRLQLAVVQEAQGDYPGASEAIDAALKRAPDDWRAWVISARVRTRMNDPAGVRRAIGEARQLNPCLPLFAGPDGSACRR